MTGKLAAISSNVKTGFKLHATGLIWQQLLQQS